MGYFFLLIINPSISKSVPPERLFVIIVTPINSKKQWTKPRTKHVIVFLI